MVAPEKESKAAAQRRLLHAAVDKQPDDIECWLKHLMCEVESSSDSRTSRHRLLRRFTRAVLSVSPPPASAPAALLRSYVVIWAHYIALQRRIDVSAGDQLHSKFPPISVADKDAAERLLAAELPAATAKFASRAAATPSARRAFTPARVNGAKTPATVSGAQAPATGATARKERKKLLGTRFGLGGWPCARACVRGWALLLTVRVAQAERCAWRSRRRRRRPQRRPQSRPAAAARAARTAAAARTAGATVAAGEDDGAAMGGAWAAAARAV